MNINNRSKYRQFFIIVRYKFTKFGEVSQKFSIRKCDNGQRWVKSRYTIVDRKRIFTVVRGKWHVSRERNKFQLLEIERKIPGWKRLIESGKLIRAKSITIRVCHAWMSNGRIHRFLLTHANNILGGETFYLYDTDIQITIETRLISRARLSSIRNNFPSLLEYWTFRKFSSLFVLFFLFLFFLQFYFISFWTIFFDFFLFDGRWWIWILNCW